MQLVDGYMVEKTYWFSIFKTYPWENLVRGTSGSTTKSFALLLERTGVHFEGVLMLIWKTVTSNVLPNVLLYF